MTYRKNKRGSEEVIINGIKYRVIYNKKDIVKNYRINQKKELVATKHSSQRWKERSDPKKKEYFQRYISSSFKIHHIKKVIIKEDKTRIYISHKKIAFITKKDRNSNNHVIVTILTYNDVKDNPAKSWWFE